MSVGYYYDYRKFIYKKLNYTKEWEESVILNNDHTVYAASITILL